jgi:hypothetical protein
MIAPAKETPSQAKRQPFEIIECEIARFRDIVDFQGLDRDFVSPLFLALAERRKKGGRQLNLSDTAPTIADISGKRNSFHTPVDVAGWNGGCENRP